MSCRSLSLNLVFIKINKVSKQVSGKLNKEEIGIRFFDLDNDMRCPTEGQVYILSWAEFLNFRVKEKNPRENAKITTKIVEHPPPSTTASTACVQYTINTTPMHVAPSTPHSRGFNVDEYGHRTDCLKPSFAFLFYGISTNI